LLGGGWGLYALGRSHAPGNWESYQLEKQRLSEARRRLVDENRRLRAKNRGLSERVVALERANDIEQTAESELRKSLSELQGRVAELKKELAFYRGIVSPEEAKAGVRVHQFEVRNGQDSGTYHFRLVLVHAGAEEKVSGQVEIGVRGVEGDTTRKLSFSEIALDSDGLLVFTFRYFQELAGAFRLPEGFEPLQVRVEVAPEARDKDAFETTYDWQEVARTS